MLEVQKYAPEKAAILFLCVKSAILFVRSTLPSPRLRELRLCDEWHNVPGDLMKMIEI